MAMFIAGMILFLVGAFLPTDIVDNVFVASMGFIMGVYGAVTIVLVGKRWQ